MTENLQRSDGPETTPSSIDTKNEEAAKQLEKSQIPIQVFQAFEKRDEDQILAEMRGELIEDLVYSIDIQGRRVTNLSYAGVKEAIRRRGNLEILEVRTEETEKEIRALVRVRDLDNRIDVLGASSSEKDRPFAYVLAVNKAERNAMAKLIPAKWYATLIKDWLEMHRPSKAQIPNEPVAQSEQLSDDMLENLPWKPYKEGHRAAWIFADRAPASLIKAIILNGGSIEIGEFQYKFSGPKEDPERFISRSPIKDE
jgi:hypothetical protein